jgi:hypothetical protein
VTETSNVFLRWARLKQEAEKGPSSEAATTGIESAAPRAGSGASNHERFDAASLPSIDTIAADTDIVAFLQSGVPAELTRAALRRAWTSDPAIRNFIGIAENQWDFNDPNGIPGFGPLDTMRGQVACLSQVSPSSGMPDLLAEETSPDARDSKLDQSQQSVFVQHAHCGLANCILPVFHPATSAKHMQEQRMRMPSDSTMRLAAVGVMAAPCRDSAEHSRSWRLLHFGLSK